MTLSTSIDRSKLRIKINRYPKQVLIHTLVDMVIMDFDMGYGIWGM